MAMFNGAILIRMLQVDQAIFKIRQTAIGGLEEHLKIKKAEPEPEEAWIKKREKELARIKGNQEILLEDISLMSLSYRNTLRSPGDPELRPVLTGGIERHTQKSDRPTAPTPKRHAPLNGALAVSTPTCPRFGGASSFRNWI